MSMVKLSSLLVNSSDAIDGVWIPIQGPFEAKVARANNPRFRAAFQRLLAAEMIEHNAQTMDDLPKDTLEKVTLGAMSEAIWTDLRGLCDDEGEPTPYSSEFVLGILSNPDAYEIREKIEAAAMSKSIYSAKEQAEVLEKCKPESDGTSKSPETTEKISDS